MDTITRAKNICLNPGTEWNVIAQENTPPGALVTGYVVPLAAVGAVAGLIGGSLVGVTVPFFGHYRVPITQGITTAAFALVMAVVGVFILAALINALAPTFNAEKNQPQAMKVAVYSYTPAWIAGVLQLLPALTGLIIIASLYGLYLLYLGLPRLMKCPQEKAAAYTAVVVVCAIVVGVVTMGIAVALGLGAMSRGQFGAAPGSFGTNSGIFGSPSPVPAPAATVDPNSPLGKLEALGKQLEQSGRKMDAAEKAGDQQAQVAAAFEGLGTLFGGGKRVDPIDIAQLKPFVPDTFAGLPKASSNAEKNGIAGMAVSKAEATYREEGKRVTLGISDTGGVSGLVGLVGWAGIQGEKEDDQASEKTEKVGGRLVHQRASKTGGANEFSIVLGDRFIVEARGEGVDLNALKAAVAGLDLAKLESMKDVGVQK